MPDRVGHGHRHGRGHGHGHGHGYGHGYGHGLDRTRGGCTDGPFFGGFGELANASQTTLVVPANVADVASMVTLAMNFLKPSRPGSA